MSSRNQREVWRRHVRQYYVGGEEIPEHYNAVQRKEAHLMTLRATGPRKGIRHGNEINGKRRIETEPMLRFPVLKRRVHPWQK